MSKTKNAAAAEDVNRPVGDTETPPPFDESEFQQVDLFRLWVRFNDVQTPVYIRPIMRSVNVRHLYPSKFPGQKDQELFIWACELSCSVSKAHNIVFRGEEAVAAAASTPVYLFEPALLAPALETASNKGYILRVRSTGKAQVKSRKWGTVNARQYEVSMRPRFVPVTDGLDSMLMLPQAGSEADSDILQAAAAAEADEAHSNA